MQSIKQWHTPSDRAYDQPFISISWSAYSPFLIALLFTSLFITVAQNRYQAGARLCIARRRKCFTTEMSRCFKNEISLCIHYSHEIDEISPRLLLSLQCCYIRRMKDAWSAEKGDEEKSKSRNYAEKLLCCYNQLSAAVRFFFVCTG